MASSRRCSRWRRCAPTISRGYGIGRYAGSRSSTKLKVTGVDLFSAGDFMGGDGTEEIVLADPGRRRLQEARAQGRHARRRRAVRRHGRRRAGTSSCCATAQRRRDPRPADVRRGEPRRHRPPGPERARWRWPTTPKSAAATACARARSSRRSRTRACSRSTRCASTPRRRRRAARAPASSSSC